MFREFAFLVLTSPICLGAWEDVVALHKGDRVGVVQSDKKRIEGRFDSATGSTITLEENGAIQSLSRDQVVRVYARPKVNRVARRLGQWVASPLMPALGNDFVMKVKKLAAPCMESASGLGRQLAP